MKPTQTEAIKWCPQHGYPLPCGKCGLGQYELGRQAGIKEMVKWMQKRDCSYRLFNEYVHAFKVIDEEWQSKLKEWGC